MKRTAPRELFARWQQEGDQAARAQLVERFLPLARKLSRRYGGAHESPEDLLQVASYGLLKAIDRFDAERGIAFSTFAVPTILGELKRYLRDLGWSVHMPRRAQELALRVEIAQVALSAQTDRPPATAELAQHTGLDIEDVLEGLLAASAHHSLSLDAPLDGGDGEPSTLADVLAREDAGFRLVDDAATYAGPLRTLSTPEQQVLHLRFVEDLTQTDIGSRVGLSQPQVSRLLRRAIATLGELTRPATPAPPTFKVPQTT